MYFRYNYPCLLLQHDSTKIFLPDSYDDVLLVKDTTNQVRIQRRENPTSTLKKTSLANSVVVYGIIKS